MKTVDQMLAEYSARARTYEASLRAEFIASGESVPDLNLMPSCSVCSGDDMDYDEGFHCRSCDIHWDHNGTDGEVQS